MAIMAKKELVSEMDLGSANSFLGAVKNHFAD
jgi:hypothetical protein